MNLLITLFLKLSFFIWPVIQEKAQDCSCSDSFVKAVDTYEKNYSLFAFKVTDENQDLYRAHTDVMRQKAMQAADLQDCKMVIEQWLEFFRDGHNYLKISLNSKVNKEVISLSENQFKSDYKRKNYKKNPLLGIWQNEENKLAIIPNPKGSNKERDFVGVVLESTNETWHKDDVKFELFNDFGSNYNAQFMRSDESPRITKAQQISSGKLKFDDLGVWTKVWPETDIEVEGSEVVRKFNQFHYTELEGIPYLRFPDFWTVDGKYVDSIMKIHHKKLQEADFIIVDVRNNRGGNDATYYPILPYILSGPVEIPNTGHWMSEANIQQFLEQSDLKGKSLDEYTEEERQIHDYVMLLKGTAYFQQSEYAYTYEPDTIYAGPQKVILLTNEKTVSSAETFVYRANQSNKVVVYGQNTAGIVDGFNGLSVNIGCFELTYPSSFRAKDLDKNPIDPYGIAPDIYVDEKVDVLKYAIEHMKQLIKNEGDLISQ